MVLADGPQTAAGLERALAEGLIDKVGFTGSTDVGRRIGELCGRHLQSPCLELGGKNPLVVMPDAELDLAVEGALFSGFGTAGQRCTSLGTAIVHASVHDEFLRRFTAAVGHSPAEEIRRARIERVRQFLTSTDMSIPDIAEACGFAYAEHMIPLFARYHGRTPAAFRRNLRGTAPVA